MCKAFEILIFLFCYFSFYFVTNKNHMCLVFFFCYFSFYFVTNKNHMCLVAWTEQIVNQQKCRQTTTTLNLWNMLHVYMMLICLFYLGILIGGILHIHDESMTPISWLVKNVTYRDNCYICIKLDYTITFKFYQTPPSGMDQGKSDVMCMPLY